MRTRHTPHPTVSGRSLATVAATVLLVATACSSSKRSVATDASTTSVPVAADSATTVVPTTSDSAVVETTSEPPASTTTTTTPVAAPLTLRGDGVGAFDIGMPYADVAAGVSSQLAALTDDALEFPTDEGDGSYTSADGARRFVAPHARLACWADGSTGNLCLSFGGGDPGSLTFTGWTYVGDRLLSTSGVTGGSLWSDFPAMHTPGSGGCYQYGTGEIDGIRLNLISAGATFGSFDDAGNFVPSDPAPADVSVVAMDAGSMPGDTEGDC